MHVHPKALNIFQFLMWKTIQDAMVLSQLEFLLHELRKIWTLSQKEHPVKIFLLNPPLDKITQRLAVLKRPTLFSPLSRKLLWIWCIWRKKITQSLKLSIQEGNKVFRAPVAGIISRNTLSILKYKIQRKIGSIRRTVRQVLPFQSRWIATRTTSMYRSNRLWWAQLQGGNINKVYIESHFRFAISKR